ncbi:alpha/beta hydrolase [Cellulomonas hominis]|uniref:alpha/beta hydrolase n=1 Tax=Cellulomonas hominis TaxID=156981 RepID=UPI001B9DB5C0|nr:alpha/beta hydrolase [Cellulomonas hominis]VTR75281.1 Carboxylesterase A [Cellulomonas hominis]
MPRRRALAGRVAALVAVVALALAGCVGPKEQTSVTQEPEPTAADVRGLDAIYAQQLDWQPCGDLECATLVVPLDYAEPDGDTIEIAVSRHVATGDRIGSLLINPGGPGSSGIDALSSIALPRFGKEVVERYDLVGFDPRGVASSTPVTCVDGPTMDELVSTDFDFSSDAGIAEAEAAYGAFGAACLANSGPVLEHVDTVSAAKDMDVLRAVLGDETLSYVGYSYGTQLGATYAALFPEQVGRLVLDGALDPTLSPQELSEGQAAGFESALRAYVADCQAGADCPLTGSVDDGLAQIKALLDRARRSPLPTGTDRPLTGALAFSGIALPLYDEGSWQYLTMGLDAALTEGNGAVLLQLADLYYDRNADGTYASNSTPAFWSIGCADDRGTTDVAEMRAQAAAIEAAAPTVGYFFSYGGVICAQWPVPEAGGLDDYAAQGADPILVIGTTNDPATPYAWAESLAKTLESGTLLTYEGEGHTAYGRSNACIADAVDAYLIEGTVPEEGTRC